MLIPTKHENLQQNILVVGADILFLLKKRGYNIEALFQEVKAKKDLNLEQFYNTILFLWLSDLIELENYHIVIKL